MIRRYLSLLIALFLTSAPAALACVGCRQPGQTMGDDPQIVLQAGMGFSWSVIFMLVFVLSILTFFSAYTVRFCARIDKQKSEKQGL